MNQSAQNEDISYWRLASELEEGRNHVLQMVARHEPLELILNTLCQKAQIYNKDMLCSVLRLNSETKTLHPIASVSLPEFYCQALNGVAIGLGVGSCGTAAFIKKRVVVEDINTHPYWSQYKDLALQAGVQACWSEPIIGADGLVFGTFAIYYREPKAPTEEDLKFIELSANLSAVVFENHSNREQLLNANNQLNKTINKRNAELELVNSQLRKAIKDQSLQYSSDIKVERMMATNRLVAGFSLEINTPVGKALTAISSASDKLFELNEKISTNTLSRKYLMNCMHDLSQQIEFNKHSLIKADQLLQRFQEISTSENQEQTSIINMRDFLVEVKESLTVLLGSHQLHWQSDDINIQANKETLWHIFFNLVENSIIHGFENKGAGSIQINVAQESDELIINYQDNGSGITEERSSRIFEPFYTSCRNGENVGLGLSITSNLINHNLKGRIRLIESPVGVRYEIIIPLNGNLNSPV